MSGSTLTMAPAFVPEPSDAALSRSHSSPDLLGRGRSLSSPDDQRGGGLSLGSFSPTLESFDVPSFDSSPDFEMRLHFDDRGDLAKTESSAIDDEKAATKPLVHPAPLQQQVEEEEKPSKFRRYSSFTDKSLSWIPSSKSTSNVRDYLAERPSTHAGEPAEPSGLRDASSLDAFDMRRGSEDRSKKVADSFASFARRTWMSASSSRPPSPSSTEEEVQAATSARSRDSGRGGARGRDGPGSTGSGSGSGSAAAAAAAAERSTTPRRKRLMPVVDPDATQQQQQQATRPSSAHAPAQPQSQPQSQSQPQAADAPKGGSSSRTLNRATSYLSRMRTRPQSVLVRLGSGNSNPNNNNSSGNTSAASSATSLATPTATSTITSEHQGTFRTASFADDSSNSTMDDSAGSSDRPPSRKRDPLWNAFKTLELEVGKLAAKNVAGRMTLVRTTLLSFLRNTASHESNKGLRPEDIERRASILDKWWRGLLEMLEARGAAVLPGTDRPVLLDALMMIMTRPEWRQATPCFTALSDRKQPAPEEEEEENVGGNGNAGCGNGDGGRSRSWTDSTSSSLSFTQAQFVAESAEHNVRTMFVTNLISQLPIVVDKMSLRHAPANLVNFCGKALAYAFFFVPGAADVLVRLWNLTPDLVRRTARELELPETALGMELGMGLYATKSKKDTANDNAQDGKPNKTGSENSSADVADRFPPRLAPLVWTDAKTIIRDLNLASNARNNGGIKPLAILPDQNLPLNISRLPWNGPWVSRWRARDTDLFFVFAKYFHVLTEEFTPPGTPLAEKARSPGFVLVHAQLLSTINSTIHRTDSGDSFLGVGGAGLSPFGSPNASFGSFGALADPNFTKTMSENRLIVLLKDFLSSDEAHLLSAKRTFAQCFSAVMMASARRISLYDHDGCYTLCDFLEEALAAYAGFEDDDDEGDKNEAKGAEPKDAERARKKGKRGRRHEAGGNSGTNLIDWGFWLDVMKAMTTSHNAMTEVRLLTLVFTTWDTVAADPRRKEAVCLDWLLTEKTFNEYFNHWCPMVRAYYMRLLCWRICRDLGSANEVDTKIFLAAASRLKTAWSHYLYLKEQAELKGKPPQSTAPCLPTPGKKFMIIRTEVDTPQPGLFLTFDTLSKSINGLDAAASASGLADMNTTAGSPAPSTKSEGKKRWSLLGKVLSITTGGNSASSSDDDELEQARRDTAAAARTSRPPSSDFSSSTPANPPKPPPKPRGASRQSNSSGSSTGSSPVYAEQQYVFKFTLGVHVHQPNQPRERILARPKLPAPAQAKVNLRTRSGGDPPAVPGAGMPAPTRTISGLREGGLIHGAKNAASPSSPMSSGERGGWNGHTRQSGDGEPESPSTPRASEEAAPQLSFSPGLVRSLSEPFDGLNLDNSKDEDEDGDSDDNDDAATGNTVSAGDGDKGNKADAVRDGGETNDNTGGGQDECASLLPSSNGPTPTTASRPTRDVRSFTTTSVATVATVNTVKTVNTTATQPAKPEGIYAAKGPYTGRALAEWSVVVQECNNFIARRRDEGVLGLADVEVPQLAVEGFRRLG